MTMLLAAVALAAAQSAPAASVDHSQHTPAQQAQHQQGQQQGQHAQHQGEHKCCKKVNGKMECQMMKGHGTEKGQADHQGRSGH